MGEGTWTKRPFNRLLSLIRGEVLFLSSMHGIA